MAKSLIEKVWINFTLIFILGLMFFFNLAVQLDSWISILKSSSPILKVGVSKVQPVGMILGGAGSDCCKLALKTTEKQKWLQRMAAARFSVDVVAAIKSKL